MVLGLLAITLALSYAMLRNQTTTQLIHANYGRRENARQAAAAALSIGIREMSNSGWSGVGVDLTGSLDQDTSYVVTYQTGDPSLSAGDADYSSLPYRVTVTSTASTADPVNPGLLTTNSARAVVELIPRKLVDPPSTWDSLQGYTVYQWGTGGSDSVRLELPSQVEGAVRFQNQILLAEDYPTDGLERPFAGAIDQVAVFSTALSATQIADLANGTVTVSDVAGDPANGAVSWWQLDEVAGANVATDAIGSADGRYEGAQAGASPAPGVGSSAAAAFDGFNDQVLIPPLDVNGSQMTLLAWFKADHFDEADGRIISKATGVDNDEHYWMLSTTESSGSNRLRFRLQTSVGGVRTLVASSGSLSPGSWVFAAAVYDGSIMRLYKDGVSVGVTAHFGSVRTNAAALVSIGNNPPGSPIARYLRDLEAERVAGADDYRPLTGAIEAPRNGTEPETWSLIERDLGVSVVDTNVSGGDPVTHPGNVATYRLFPGGQFYSVPQLGSVLANTTLGPDPASNPLGLFHRANQVNISSNVTVQGTIVVSVGGDSDIELNGTNVTLEPHELPQLYGESTRRQLPVAVVADDFRVVGGASSVTGMIVAWDEFDIPEGSASIAYSGVGTVLAEELNILSRNQWDQSTTWWQDRLAEFYVAEPSLTASFPEWLEQTYGLDREPKLRLTSDPSGPSYHWPDWTQPLFEPHPDDGGGLRWEVIKWEG